jgi:translocation and assembly module TamB
LGLKATATIPLGALHDLKGYSFHGDLTLKGASIFQVDVGSVAARIDLAGGVIELTEFRGRLVDRPDGGPDNPPAPQPPVATQGALPAGGFRGDLRAKLSPPGTLSARIEGNQLPLGELTAPLWPRPTPLSGLASIRAEAEVNLAALAQPRAWSASGSVRSERIGYHGAALDSVAARVDLRAGRLEVSALRAQLAGRPLTARLDLDLAAARAFHATVDVAGWSLADLIAWLPGAPRPPPIAGALTARANAKGTLVPWTIQTQGSGRFDRLEAGPVLLGAVPFRWTTDREAIVVSVDDAQPFGGRLDAEARVPTTPGRATVGSATIRALDTARLTAAMPEHGLKLTGQADGRASFTVPAGGSALEANIDLSAPDLTVQGLSARRVHASVRARRGTLMYEVTAEELGIGGRLKFQGTVPLSAAPNHAETRGELRIVGFTLGGLGEAIGAAGARERLGGLGALDANVRAALSGSALWAHGAVELRDVRWGGNDPLGHLRGIVAITPVSWRVDPIQGELLGGPASGLAWGETPARGPRRRGFGLRIDRAALKRLTAVAPDVARQLDGFGTLRLTGRFEEAVRATAELNVARGRVAGLPLSDLRAPAELVLVPGSGAGAVHVRGWSTRLAGGLLRGDAWFRLGADHSFHGQAQLADLDLETVARVATEARQPASGRISGRITLDGPDPAQLQRLRGKLVLDLDDGSLVALPVFREIDQFLGSARGGIFEDGDLIATIAHRQLVVEMLTLEGRLAQLHAAGTVGFDGQLNLAVLVNTNQIIPQTGQALVALIPGLRDALRRGERAAVRVAGYLSSRLLKLRVTGTLRNPSVALDPAIIVADAAVAFFAGVLKLPLGLVR